MIAFRLPAGASGFPERVLECRALPIGGPRTRTDIAFDRASRRLLVIDDVEPLVHSGPIAAPTAWVPQGVPTVQATARTGKGLSAITVDQGTGSVWIANREALPADGPPAIGRLGTVVRLCEVGGQELFYRVDPAHEGRRWTPGVSSSGVAAIAGVGDGRLLVMEASRVPTMPRFRNRLFVADPADAGVSDGGVTGGHLDAGQFVGKSLIWEQSSGVCLEGLCAGPTLPNGDRMLVAVGDNASLGTPTTLIILRWSPSDRESPLSGFGWPLFAGLAALGLGWGALRVAIAVRRTRCGSDRVQAPVRLVLT
ncbi:MAG: esterase-like activity of phytase family protein [Sphaerospermopsis kisseleviana]